MPPEEAYKKIYDYFSKDYIGSDDEDVFWLGIALYHWKNGILLDEVKKNALRCIDDGEYLERWKERGKKVYQKRKETLRILKEKLLNEVNPVRTKFPKCPIYYRKKTDLKVGDLLAYIIHKPGKAIKQDDPFYNNLYQKKKDLDKKIADTLKFIPIVEEYRNGKRRVVSNISLDCTDIGKELILYMG